MELVITPMMLTHEEVVLNVKPFKQIENFSRTSAVKEEYMVL